MSNILKKKYAINKKKTLTVLMESGLTHNEDLNWSLIM